jgi:Icc-related predicted phosphoesterase
MKCTAISDTHGKHGFAKLPGGDILIHAGDLTDIGAPSQLKDFLAWFAVQDYKYKIFIPGNHDFVCEDPLEVEQIILDEGYFRKGVIYLSELNTECTEIEGYNFWGSPYTPEFYDWAFMYKRGEGHVHWNRIPANTDILITHGPPSLPKDLQLTDTGFDAGCAELWETVKKIQPRYHIFGHIHEARGTREVGWETKTTVFANVSYLTSQYRPYRDPVYTFELPTKN